LFFVVFTYIIFGSIMLWTATYTANRPVDNFGGFTKADMVLSNFSDNGNKRDKYNSITGHQDLYLLGYIV